MMDSIHIVTVIATNSASPCEFSHGPGHERHDFVNKNNGFFIFSPMRNGRNHPAFVTYLVCLSQFQAVFYRNDTLCGGDCFFDQQEYSFETSHFSPHAVSKREIGLATILETQRQDRYDAAAQTSRCPVNVSKRMVVPV